MAYHDWHGRPGYYRDITRHFPRDARMLDVGCGTGWLSDDFPDYVGVDNSTQTVEEAQAAGIDVRQADLQGNLPLEDAEFDGVVLKDVLEHLSDPVHLVQEVHRVLRPGGQAFASSPDAQRWSWDDYTHRRPFTRTSMRRLFADNGFDVDKVSYESVMPGTSMVSARTRRKQRPRPLVALTWLPGWRRNVWVLARRAG
jgi:SAM-dependent methyltransferase